LETKHEPLQMPNMGQRGKGPKRWVRTGNKFGPKGKALVEASGMMCSAYCLHTRAILKVRTVLLWKKWKLLSLLDTACLYFYVVPIGPPLWSSGQSSWLQIRRPGFDSRHYQKKEK
jgi:hypothetical protein